MPKASPPAEGTLTGFASGAPEAAEPSGPARPRPLHGPAPRLRPNLRPARTTRRTSAGPRPGIGPCLPPIRPAFRPRPSPRGSASLKVCPDSGSRKTHALCGTAALPWLREMLSARARCASGGGARLQEVRGRPGPWRRLPSSSCCSGRLPGGRPRPPATSSGLASRQPTSCRGRRPADGKRMPLPSAGPGPGPGAQGREAGLRDRVRSSGASVCLTPLAPWPGDASQGHLATAASRSPLEG